MTVPPFPSSREIALLLGVAGIAFAFGVTLKVSDLLQEHGYRWFRGSAIAVGALATVGLLALLWLGNPGQRIFWLAVVLHWVLRGRIDGVNHGLFATAALIFLIWSGPPLAGEHLRVFLYFFVPLAGLGLLHDLFQYTNAAAPRAVRWFFRNQHLYWYLVGLGYFIAFERDLALVVVLYAFVKGYGFFYRPERTALLERLGIRGPAG